MRWSVSRTGLVIITALLWADPALAQGSSMGNDMALLFDRCVGLMEGEMSRAGELPTLAVKIGDRAKSMEAHTADGRLAAQAVVNGCERLRAKLAAFEESLASGQFLEADGFYRNELLPLFFELAVAGKVIEEQEKHNARVR